MPAPATIHNNTALSTFASVYKPGGVIGPELCPDIMVDLSNDDFDKLTRKDPTTEFDDEIGPEGEVHEADYEKTTDSYRIRDFALKGRISYREISDAERSKSPATNDPVERRVMFLKWKLMLKYEKRIADAMATVGNYASGNSFAASNGAWTLATATPVKDIQAAIAVIAPGMEFETELVGGCSLEVYQSLSRHPELLGLRAGGGSQAGVATATEIAAALGLDRIVVANIQRNTANRGVATPTLARVWPTNEFYVVRRPPGEPSGLTTAFLATFRLRTNPGNMIGQQQESWIVAEWEIPDWGSWGAKGVKVASNYHPAKLVQNDMGARITGV